MGLFSKQLANVVEWNEVREDILFWKWSNKEIKKGSKLIVRPGQDAIFLYNGRVEGIFEDEGSYDIESEIIPFLSTLKGFKFGFNSGLRAEVLFINTKEHLVKWGTKNAINLPAPGLPGGMPIRAFGTFSCKIADHMVLIDKLAGIKQMYTVEDVKERIVSEFGAVACETEGAAIAHTAFVNGVAFAVVRAISDSADGDATMDYPAFLPIAAKNSTALTLELVSNY